MRGLVCSGVTEGGTYSIVLVFDKGSRFDRRLPFFFIGHSNLILFRFLSRQYEKYSLISFRLICDVTSGCVSFDGASE